MTAGLIRVKITGVPENLDKRLFVEAMLGKQFMIHHDFSSGEMVLISDYETSINTLRRAMPGIELEPVEDIVPLAREGLCFVVAEPRDDSGAVDGLYRMFGGRNACMVTSFVPAKPELVLAVKHRVERMLSGKETGFTESSSARAAASSQTASRHMESYYGSEEKEFLTCALESMKNASLMNGSAYRVVIALFGDCGVISKYISSKFLILERFGVRAGSVEELYGKIAHVEAMPFDSMSAARLLGFPNSAKINKLIGSHNGKRTGKIAFGTELEGSVTENGRIVAADVDAFNLGTLISGVPGTGKTFAAMHIAGQLAGTEGVHTVVISPTGEWNGFGHSKGFRVISLKRSGMRLNFFKCDSGIGIEKFYENLAMLLASASDAGPYTNSLEKCLLAAFRRAYAEGRDPDPVSLYDQIEEAIIEQHGRRGGAGVKYTKHGENAWAALENLRSMLNRPEFSKREGADFTQLLNQGVVFDLSEVSNKMKQFYYALILNQVYSITDQLDTEGDKKLRLLVCAEEAQTIFRADKNSAVAADLLQRIQDFRKKGVGLVLITHSVTDIDQGIRRLCQTKLYFRQSADVARFAASDLLFGEEEKDALVDKLKGLGQRTCAINYLQGRETPAATFAMLPIVATTELFQMEPADKDTAGARVYATIKVVDKEGVAKEGKKFQVFYVGEKIFQGSTGSDGKAQIPNTIRDNMHKLVILGEKRKDSRTFRIAGGEVNIIEI